MVARENEEEDNLLGATHSVISALVKLPNYTTIYPALGTALLPMFVDLLGPGHSAGERMAALCVLDDVVMHCGPVARPLLPGFYPACHAAVVDPAPSVRQAANYGLAVLAVTLVSGW